MSNHGFSLLIWNRIKFSYEIEIQKTYCFVCQFENTCIWTSVWIKDPWFGVSAGRYYTLKLHGHLRPITSNNVKLHAARFFYACVIFIVPANRSPERRTKMLRWEERKLSCRLLTWNRPVFSMTVPDFPQHLDQFWWLHSVIVVTFWGS